MLPDRNDQELAAMRRLSANGDFSVFVGWVRRCLDAKRDELVNCEGDVPLRWRQGQAQALQDVVSAVESTRTVSDRRGI